MGHPGEQGAEGRELLRVHQVALAQLKLPEHFVEGIGEGDDLPVPRVDADVLEAAVGDDLHAHFHQLQRFHDHARHDLADGDDHDDQDRDRDDQDAPRTGQQQLKVPALRLRHFLGDGDDVLAGPPEVSRQLDLERAVDLRALIFLAPDEILVAAHEVLVQLQVVPEADDPVPGLHGSEGGDVRVEKLARPRHVPDVLLVIGQLLVQKVVLFEPPNLKGGVKELGNGLARHDLLFEVVQLDEGEGGKPHDHDDDGVVADLDFLSDA